MFDIGDNGFAVETFQFFGYDLDLPASFRRNSRNDRIFFLDLLQFRVGNEVFPYFAPDLFNDIVRSTFVFQFSLVQ